MITSIAGVTIVINTLTCTLIIRYLLYAPCMGKGLPSFRRGRGRLFPFGGVGGGFSLSEGSGEAFYSQSQNHNHKITKRIFNV